MSARSSARIGGASDHDVYHLTHTLAPVRQANIPALTPHGQRYGADLDPAAATG